MREFNRLIAVGAGIYIAYAVGGLCLIGWLIWREVKPVRARATKLPGVYRSRHCRPSLARRVGRWLGVAR